MKGLDGFTQIWLVDFEFRQPDGHRPHPVCMVAREFGTGRLIRLWGEELLRLTGPPYSVAPDSLFVAFYGSAELGCHLALDWLMPTRVLDLYAEFRCLTSG